jgi:hypothetical protein
MKLYDVAHDAGLVFGSWFVIVDPIATVTAFPAMASHDTPAQPSARCGRLPR